MMEYRIGPIKKANAPLTSNPFNILLTSQNKKALIISKNRPKVNIVIGMVKTTKIGLITALTRASAAAAIKAET